MTMRRTMAIAGLMMLGTWHIAAWQQRVDPEALFQAALYKEQVELQLDQAIAGYKDVLAAAESNKTLAAKALLQMAGCYERLGRSEAIAAYERIVSEFSSVEPAAGIARKKLATNAQRSAGLSETKVWDDIGDNVSPDGKYISFTDWEKGDLATFEVATGRTQHLTRQSSWNNQYAEGSAFSSDSRLIAYSWHTNVNNTCELRIIDRNGGKYRTVWAGEAGAYLWPLAWTPDNKSVLVTIDRNVAGGGTTQHRRLAFIALDSGAVRVLKEFTLPDRQFKMNPTLSSDGRFIAYSLRPAAEKPERDVYVLSIETGEVTAVVQHPADDDVLGWFPTGDRLLFASDRSGRFDIWAARIVGGRAEEPALIRTDVGQVSSTGFTRNGSFYYGTRGGREVDVFVATLNSQTGQSEGPLARLGSRYIGRKIHAAWSPKGDRLAYIQPAAVQVAGPSRDTHLGIHTMATSQSRIFELALQNVQFPAWMPDGRAVLVQGRDLEGRQGLFTIDSETGAMTPLVAQSAAAKEIQRTHPTVSPDGRQIFFRWNESGTMANAAVGVRDLATGTEQKLIEPHIPAFALSPDGRWLATLTRQGSEIVYSVSVLASTGGVARRVAPSFVATGQLIAWAADSRSVFVTKSGGRGQELWRVPVDGGAPVQTGVTWTGPVSRISAHPDGRRIALSTSRASAETRVLENISGSR